MSPLRARISKVGVWVAARRSERTRIERRLAGLIELEESYDFDPARRDEDFEALRRLLPE